MIISINDKLPDATFTSLEDNGPVSYSISDITKGRKIIIFALPGAYTGVCSTAHLPSFIRTANAIRNKGVDAIYCLSVNDVFVMQAWAKEHGAHEAGIIMLSDADAAYTKSIGMDFTVPAVGLINRSKRYAMIVNDRSVSALQLEETPGTCNVSGGEEILDIL